ARLDVGGTFGRAAGAAGPAVSGDLDEIGNSPIAAVGAGYRFNRNLRLHLTPGYAGGHELDDTDAAGQRFTAHLRPCPTPPHIYLDYPLRDWRPYVTAGAGVSRNTLGTVSRPGLASLDGGTTTAFAWQAGIGVA